MAELCFVAGVSRSGYYNSESNASKREADELKERADFELILEAYKYKGINKGVNYSPQSGHHP